MISNRVLLSKVFADGGNPKSGAQVFKAKDSSLAGTYKFSTEGKFKGDPRQIHLDCNRGVRIWDADEMTINDSDILTHIGN